MRNELNAQQLLLIFREGTMVPERAGEYWSAEEQEELQNLYSAGVGISEIAIKLQRYEGAIIQQLIAKDLLTPPTNKRSRGRTEHGCLCKKCQHRNACTKYLANKNRQKKEYICPLIFEDNERHGL